jgi:hypothetical protein
VNEPILTKKQIAERLQVSPRTVTSLNLPHLKVGGQNRYYWSEVEEYLRRGEKPAAKIVALRPKGAA